MQALAQAARLANGSADVQLIYGAMLERLGRDDDARAAYLAALALQPNLRESAFFSAGASLTPSPVIPTMWPRC